MNHSSRTIPSISRVYNALLPHRGQIVFIIVTIVPNSIRCINITFGGSANNDDNNNTSVQQTFWSTNNDNDNGAPIPNLANQMQMNSQQQLQNTTNNNASVQQTFFWPGARQAVKLPPRLQLQNS